MKKTDFTSRFFYTGGALPPEALSYIPRVADEQLFTRLHNGDYCYVLVSRQMGKSSLMVHTLPRLIQHNITAMMIDLNSIGDDASQEQWYYSLAEQLAGQLGLIAEIDAFWDRAEGKTALQKWVGMLEQLLHLYTDRALVIFIDEIDQVRSLRFKTDEFFAAIRSFHNRRATEASFRRLTFCLIGVALPSDLIKDPRITPFNIAERIDLTDFSEEQVVTLKAGLQREEIQEEVMMQRVFYWTQGHPYLTQRLCRAIVEDASIQTGQDVDRLCERLFFDADAATPDDNIALVSTRLLHSDPDVVGLLTLFKRIVQGKSVHYDKANRLINLLMLAGAIRSVNGHLQVRNRIYARVFNTQWVHDQMPDAALRLQKQAYRRGAARALSLTSVVIALMGFLLYRTFRAERNTQHALGIAREERDKANFELYVANTALAQKAYEEGNLLRAQQLLTECRNQEGLQAYCDFAWRYLWELVHQAHYTLAGHTSRVSSVAFTADSRNVVTVDQDATIRLWPTATKNRTVKTFTNRYGIVTATAISADAAKIGIATRDHRVLLHSSVTGQVTGHLTGFRQSVCSLALSHNGRLLAAGAYDGSVTLWRCADGALLHTFPGNKTWCEALAFAPKDDLLFAADARGDAWICDVSTGFTRAALPHDSYRILAAAFSPDGRTLATGISDGRVLLWDPVQKTVRKELPGRHNQAMALTFSADGQELAVSADTTVTLWNVVSGVRLRALGGHRDRIQCIAFDSHGHRLVTGSIDQTAKVWDLTTAYTHQLGPEHSTILCLDTSPDGQTAAIAGDNGPVEIWRLATGRPLTTLPQKALTLAFARDNRTLITAASTGTVIANDLTTRSASEICREGEPIWALALSPFHEEVVIGSEEGSLKRTDRAGHLLGTIRTSLSGTANLAIASDGSLLAVSDKNGAGLLTDYPSGRVLADFSKGGARCRSFCFSPDSSKLAIGFADGTVELWDTRLAKNIWRVPGHVRNIRAIAFSPDGVNLVTGSDDLKVHIWNVRQGREVGTLEGHRDSICSLHFAPDGSSLISIDQSRMMMLWPAPLQGTNATTTP